MLEEYKDILSVIASSATIPLMLSPSYVTFLMLILLIRKPVSDPKPIF